MSSGPDRQLPRDRRIQLGRDFSRIKSGGRRMVRGCLIANWLPVPDGHSSRLGVITSAKIGNAVVRSRARRLLREAFRQHQAELDHPVEMVLVARASIVGKSFQEAEADYLTVLRQAGLLRDKP
jgi:ribonuclease P protein component